MSIADVRAHGWLGRNPVDAVRDPRAHDGVDVSEIRPSLTLVEPASAVTWLQHRRRGLTAFDLAAAVLSSLICVVLVGLPIAAASALVAALPLAWIAALSLGRAYDASLAGSGPLELRRVAKAGLGLLGLGAFVAYAAALGWARPIVLGAIPATIVLTMAGRLMMQRRLRAHRRAGRCTSSVVLVGDDRAVLALLDELNRSDQHGLLPVAACLTHGSDVAAVRSAGLVTFSGVETAVDALGEMAANAVVILPGPVLSGPRLRQLCWDLEGKDASVMVCPGLVEVADSRLHVATVAGVPMVRVREPRSSRSSQVTKGVFDRTAAAAALVVLSPLLLTIALAIKVTSPGPVLYRQDRSGMNGRLFPMLKFRSMVVDADKAARTELADANEVDGPLFKIRSDPRITPIGKILRRWSLDELPQLISIVRGDMSLVGPRPPLPDEVARYADSDHRRLLVKPGLTGLWQVSGRSDLSWDDSIRLDLRYVDNWSVSMDATILWRTGRAVVRGTGAY